MPCSHNEVSLRDELEHALELVDQLLLFFSSFFLLLLLLFFFFFFSVGIRLPVTSVQDGMKALGEPHYVFHPV